MDLELLRTELEALQSTPRSFELELRPELPTEELIGYYRDPEFRRSSGRPCRLIEQYSFVDPPRRLDPCLSLEMGNVFETPFEVWNGERYRAFRRLIRRERRLPLCERCPAGARHPHLSGVPRMPPLVEVAVLAFTALITMVNPLAVIPAFVAMTEGVGRGIRMEVALIAGAATAALLTAFLLAGHYVFKLFGITMPAFQIMGGFIFFVNAMRTLLEDERRLHSVGPKQVVPDEEVDPHLKVARPDVDPIAIAVVPLAIPMLAGPGAITSTMVLVNLYPAWPQKIAIIGAIIAVGIVSYIVLLAADPLSHVIGERGRVVFAKIMALLLGAIGVQFVVNGIRPLMIEMIRAGQ